jgi:tetratricopeptide (TPR) repeat protein
MVDTGSAGDGERFERIVPIALGAGANATADAEPERRVSWRLPATFAGLLLILLAVLLWLPKAVSDSAPNDASKGVRISDTAAVPQPDRAEPLAAPVASPSDVEATLQQRQHAEALAGQWRAEQGKLAAMHAAQWAVADVDALAKTAAQADAAFVARDFAAAAQGYEQAIEGAQQVQKRADVVLAAALTTGQSALQAGDAGSAAEAFARALSIDANNAEAVAGQRRALNFDAVRTQINRALAAESAGDMAAARAGFTRVLELDGGNEAARAGLARIQALAAKNAFAAQMSRGLAALEQRDYNTAQLAFQAALKMRADASEARDGLTQARLGLQSARVDTLRTAAQQAEADEQWLAARDAYAAVLAIDASLAFAQEGRQRAAQRAALAARLQAHIDQAQRLSAESVRADARTALADAAVIAAPGPRLQDQVTRLTDLLERAATPVAVTLRSDGKTRVTVYPIGELGPFASHSLSLRPGQYTAIGRRPGYREVRVAFTVTNQGVADTLFIQCEEPI